MKLYKDGITLETDAGDAERYLAAGYKKVAEPKPAEKVEKPVEKVQIPKAEKPAK